MRRLQSDEVTSGVVSTSDAMCKSVCLKVRTEVVSKGYDSYE